MSFRVVVNNTSLDLGEKARITLKAFNNAFLNGETRTEFSLPLDLPVTSKNSAAFNYLNNEHLLNPLSSFPAKFYVGELFYGNATLLVRNISASRYSANLIFGLASLISLKKKLSEFDYGGNRQIGKTIEECYAHADAVVLDNYPDRDYNFFPVFNSKFFSDKNPDWENIINNYVPGVGHKRNPVGKFHNALVPFPYMAYIIERALLDDGYTPAGSLYKMLQDEQMVLWNNREFEVLTNNSFHATRTTNQGVVSLPPALAIYPIFDDKTSPGNFDDANVYDISNGLITCTSIGKKKLTLSIDFGFVDTNTGTNAVTIDVVNSLTGFLYNHGQLFDTTVVGMGPHNITISFDFVVTPEMVGSKIYVAMFSTSASFYVTWLMLPGSFIDLVDTYANNILPDGNVINLKNHVPDITFAELLNELCTTFNSFYLINRNTGQVEFRFVNDLFNQLPKDISSSQINKEEIDFSLEPIAEFNFAFPSTDNLQEVNALPVDPSRVLGSFTSLFAGIPLPNDYEQYIFIENENRYYRSADNGSGGLKWSPYSYNYTRKVIAPNGIKIESRLSPLFMTSVVNNNGNHFLIPAIEQEGYSLQFEMTNELTGIWITFFAGMLPDSNTDTHPSAISHRLDINGNPQRNYSLQWNGEYGLMEKFYRKTINARTSGMMYSKEFRMSVADFFNFNAGNKIRANDNNFLIIESEFVIDDRNFIVAKHKLLKTI